MKVRVDKYTVAAAVICVAVLAGEACVYMPGVHSFDCDAEWGDGSVGFSVGSDGSDVYSAVLLDHGGHVPVTGLYIYTDDRYGELCEQAPADIRRLDQQYGEVQFREALKIRGFTDVESGGAEGLLDYIEGGSAGRGVLSLSFALPSEVYDGTDGSPILGWIRSGGTLYWQGSEVGRFRSADGVLEEVPGGSGLFVGPRDVNTGSVPLPTEAVGSGFTDALSLKNGELGFAVRSSEGVLSMGYGRDGYSSTSLVQAGGGAVCIFGGDFSFNMLDDAAQVIASGLTPWTSIADHAEGGVTRGTVHGSMDFEERDGLSLYIYIGGFLTKHGGTFVG